MNVTIYSLAATFRGTWIVDSGAICHKCNDKNLFIDLRHLRPVHITKIMCIKSELIRIVTVHTECALTAICFEFTFSQSTSIDSLKPDSL